MGSTSMLRIGIAGCGRAAQIHLDRLTTIKDLEIVGCADPDLGAAQALAARAAKTQGGEIPAFGDHRELLATTSPDVLGIFTPHRFHYRAAMDALQAGCHVFIEKPLSTNAQEAHDIVKLASGRGLLVGVGLQYRLCPSLVEARNRLAKGALGRLRLAVATMAIPWLGTQQATEPSWKSDPKVAGGGILAESGDHLLDALLWVTGQPAAEVAAFQDRAEPGFELVNAVALRLADGTPATLAVSGVATAPLFELSLFGERGTLRTTESTLHAFDPDTGETAVELPDASETIDGDFVAAVLAKRSPCCPGDQALDTVRLQEAIARSAASGQVVRLT